MRGKKRRLILACVALLMMVTNTYGQIRLLPAQELRQWKIPAGDYSGITPLGNDHYAIVSDKQNKDGFYEFIIEQNDTTGLVQRVELVAFHANELPSRDAEGIAFFPDSATVFIAAENDQKILEYTLDGQRTGRWLDVPDEFGLDSIHKNFGFESLSYDKDSARFWTTTENSLKKDGPLSTTESPQAAHLRLQTFDKDLKPTEQYHYDADVPNPHKRHKTLITGVSEVLALNDSNILVLERDAMLTKNGIGNRVDNRIYLFSPQDSVKTLQVDWTTRFNLTDTDFANYEGMCLGTRLTNGKQTILLLADSQGGKGNFLVRLQDYIRVGVLNDSNIIIPQRQLFRERSSLPPDSVMHVPGFERFMSNRWVTSLSIGVPLVVAGFLMRGHDQHFKSLRFDYTPKYKTHIDDYVAVLPVLVTAGLKFAGYDGRSEWSHRVVSGLFSFAITAALVRPTKSMTHTMRPDGGKNSFPSNHAAFVMGATARLVKEYGDLSPWVAYGGYGLASTVCAMRIMNNRHWMSDVLVGAGVGFLATEFSYWLADLLCPKWAYTYIRKDEVLLRDKGNPHFLGMFAGFYLPTKQFTLRDNPGLTSAHGATFGIEGAYFVNKYIGFGGQMSLSDLDYEDENGDRVDDTSRYTSIKVGCYFNYSPYPRIAFGAKLLGGYTYYPTSRHNLIDKGQHHTGVCGMAGINISLRPKEHCLFKFGFDYEIFPSPSAEQSNLQALVLTGGATIRF